MEQDFGYKRVYSQLIRLHRRRYADYLGSAGLQLLTFLLTAILAFLVINLIFDVVPAVRLIFTALVFATGGVLASKYLVPLLKEYFSPSLREIYSTARQVGSVDEQIRDALVNFIQLYQERASSGSPVIRKMALGQLANRVSLKGLGLPRRSESLARRFRPLIVLFSIYLLMSILLPGAVSQALQKIVFPWKTFYQPPPLVLTNDYKVLEVLKNDPVILSGSLTGVAPAELQLVLLDSSSTKPEEQRISIPVPRDGQFQIQVDHVRSTFTYHFCATLAGSHYRRHGIINSAIGRVLVRERPMVRHLQIKITPPSYTSLPVQLLQPDNGEISALLGSKVQLHLEADKQLTRAELQFEDSTRLPLQVAGHTAAGHFPIRKNDSYSIHLMDVDSIPNDEPVVYDIYPIYDEPPYAEIKQPGEDIELGDNLNIPLFVEIRDDFGFSSLQLRGNLIRAGSTGDTVAFKFDLPFRELEKGRGFCESNWDLIPFYLVSEDYIQYQVVVRDNDTVSGPKEFATAVFTIRLPSLLEMLEKNDIAQEEQLEDVKEVIRDSRRMNEKLSELERELKKETEMNWEKSEEIREQIENQKKAMEKLSQIREELSDMVQKMEKKNLLSPETLEKYFELQKMLEELNTPELQKAMEKLQEALKKANSNQIQKALEQFQFSAEQFEKNIDRTYELLKRVQLEQKMDELIHLAEKINQAQQQVNEKLENKNLSGQELRQLEAAEKETAQNTDYLQKKIPETNQDYQELMNQMSDLLKQSEQYMKDQQLMAKMQQMRTKLSEKNQAEAGKTGRDLKPKLDQLESMLKSARQKMMQDQKDQLAAEMQKTAQDILKVSFLQEKLAARSRQTEPASSQVQQIARRQLRLQESAHQIIRQLVELSKQTFFISPQMNQLMAGILSNIQQSIRLLENRNPRRASQSQQNAMAGLNQALLSLKNAMQQMSQASSASGFQEFMEKMQQMAGQQGQLNQQSMELFQKGQGGRMQLSADDLARLAAQQEMIRRSMEQLSEKMGNRRDVLGRMGELSEEMEKVVKELKAQRLNRKVIERQERILSRLLDAQKSIREKEHSRKRLAEREDVKVGKSPPRLREALLKQEDRLQRELLEALQEGYAPEYREYIKQYFEALSRMGSKLPE